MQIRVLIPDFGMGNVHSVERCLCLMNIDPVISTDPGEIAKADKIILPGIGHFQTAMENLSKFHMIDALHEFAQVKKKPILGICLGMQLMAKTSEEGSLAGLGWVDASVVKLKVKDSLKYKIPHIGWNQVITSKQNPLIKNIPHLSEFYFIHSYHLSFTGNKDIVCETIYETPFPSVVARENIFGVQFHPEKSHKPGSVLLENFINF